MLGLLGLQLFDEVGRGGGVHGEQRLALALLSFLPRRAAFVPQGHPSTSCQFFHGFGERQVLQRHQEVDGVPALAATEAVVQPLGRGDMETGGAFLVKRA